MTELTERLTQSSENSRENGEIGCYLWGGGNQERSVFALKQYTGKVHRKLTQRMVWLDHTRARLITMDSF